MCSTSIFQNSIVSKPNTSTSPCKSWDVVAQNKLKYILSEPFHGIFEIFSQCFRKKFYFLNEDILGPDFLTISEQYEGAEK